MRDLQGRMLAQFVVYRKRQGGSAWRSFTVTDSSRRELIRVIPAIDAADPSVFVLALDSLFAAVMAAVVTTH